MNTVKLDLKDKTITGLAGDPLGKDIAINQVINELKKTISNNQKLTIIIPSNIEDISISFVQGFLKEITKYIPKDKYYEYIKMGGTDKATADFDIGLKYRK